MPVLDLEQEATSANGLPGEPVASEFAPVDVDEFTTDDFDDLMQDDVSFADVGALPAPHAPVAASAEPTQVSAAVSEQSEHEVAHGDEAVSEVPPSRLILQLVRIFILFDKVERSSPAASQAAPAASAAPAPPAAHSVSPDVPLSLAPAP